MRSDWPPIDELGRRFAVFVGLAIFATMLGMVVYLIGSDLLRTQSGNGFGRIFVIALLVGAVVGLMLYIPVLLVGSVVWFPLMWLLGSRGYSLRVAAMISSIPCAFVAALLLPIVMNRKRLTWDALLSGQFHQPFHSILVFGLVGSVFGVLVSAMVFKKSL